MVEEDGGTTDRKRDSDHPINLSSLFHAELRTIVNRFSSAT